MAEMRANTQKKMRLSATQRKSDGKMNMATEMICDFIFVELRIFLRKQKNVFAFG